MNSFELRLLATASFIMVPILIETHVTLLIELAKQIPALLCVFSCSFLTNRASFTRLTIILNHLSLDSVRIFVIELQR